MFYYPAVLKRHSGSFSTIWLVATKGIKVPRRDFLKVNVKSTCDDIMNYVLERVPPPAPGLPKPRFSLYLSSQLQYGVVVVYHRQCAILLEELQFIVTQLLKQRDTQKIDLPDHSRQPVLLSDAVSLMEETEGALDPLFGVMHLQDPMPSPGAIIQMTRDFLRKASPERPEEGSSSASELGGGTALRAIALTTSPESITLREAEPVTIPVAEFEGEDLIDHLPDTIHLLLAETGHFSEEMPREEGIPEEPELLREGREQERDRTKELTASTTELQKTTISSEDAILSAQEEPGPPAEIPGPPADQMTPPSGLGLPTPPSAAKEREGRPASLNLEGDPAEVAVKRRRRRQLVFFDPETQLSQEEQQQRIGNPLVETRPPLLLPPPAHRVLPASELFNNPCNTLPREVELPWRRAAVTTPLSGSDLQVGERGPESTDSEREREPEPMQVEDREERLEVSPREIPREMLEAEMMDITDPETLLLEASEPKEVSREISPVPSDKESSTVSRSVSLLQDIPEVMDELSDRGEPLGFLPAVEEEPVLFQSLLPANVDRRTVSGVFQRLLENLSARTIWVDQKQPYGDILIFPGSNFQEMQSSL
ncbi:meiotic recombination protein REC8 homolog isoform X2 [Oryzias latipes]|uniref:meiotic recombination protein REC8 homolog isoform X2 n=1 Tax=Oryzias latipes TaxID=8090 RepID=UPI0009DA7FB8|nr:meiotic recombination protein REC8 homolog isoform X2 [Oryzias latipes]